MSYTELQQVRSRVAMPQEAHDFITEFGQACRPFMLAAEGRPAELDVGTEESLGMTSDWKKTCVGFRHVREMTQNWSDRCNACRSVAGAVSTDVWRRSTPSQDCHFYGMYAVSTIGVSAPTSPVSLSETLHFSHFNHTRRTRFLDWAWATSVSGKSEEPTNGTYSSLTTARI